MTFKDSLKRASKRKEELDTYRPIPVETMQRIMQKFRLDWNYHSSHIEGNQLTYGETKALILLGTTAQAKPLKDHLEMSGHNEAIKFIEDIVKQKRPLTEIFIRELHEIILKVPYKVPAITPDGKSTKKTVSIGKYKTQPNHVKTQTGEMFYFASPEETGAEMAKLLQWFNEEKDNNETHPIILATEFHYRFIRIHPFDDGNGRIARLLMNFILMQNDYPPAIIKTEDKTNYFNALQQADAGDLEFFFNYICEQVNHSLALMLKGAKGENIDEEEDLDKKLALLKQEVDKEDSEKEIKAKLSIETFEEAYRSWGINLLTKLAETTAKFNVFYDSPSHSITVKIDNNSSHVTFEKDISFDKIETIFENPDTHQYVNKASIRFSTSFGVYKKGGLDPFGCNYALEIKFETYRYEILIDYFNANEKREKLVYAERLLHIPLTTKEINEISKNWGETLYQHLLHHRK